MRISLDWLSDYIQVPFTPDDLAHRLTMLGIEVEAIERPGERMDKVVVGEVLEVTPHPNADKLRLARVSIGEGEPLRIVCGAPNVRAGLKVAVATIGANLGEGFIIKKSKIRGETSEGMICSERELGVSDKHEGIWELPDDLAVGAPLAEALSLDDTIFEIGITPNRADCLSHVGIMREIHAITGGWVSVPEVKIADAGGAIAKEVRVSLPEPDLCPRYIAKLVKGVTVAPSPDWLKRRLESVGLRPRNNVVDVTNFVLMECGHPLHAFDFSTVANGHVVVRTAGGFAEDYVTLDGKRRKLPATALLIADETKPLGIAGIMGGGNSEISESTRDVLIESAYFNPSSIRRTAKQLGLSTDASYRFERGTDINVLPYAAARAAELIADLTGGEIVEGVIDEYPKPLPKKTFHFRPARANMLIGMNIPEERMTEIFGRLSIDSSEAGEGQWLLTSPSHRVDLEREEDAIEEIARFVGYDEIPTSTFERAPLGAMRDPLKRREFDEIVRSTLLSIGATECVSVPLVSAKDAKQFSEAPVELINPLNIEKDRMRPSIAINLLDAARHNERFGAEGQRMFEMGNVFQYHPEKQMLGHVRETTEIGVLISGIQEPKTPYNAEAIKADLFLLRGITDGLAGRTGIGKLDYRAASASFLESTECLDVFAGSRADQSCARKVGVIGKLSQHLAKDHDLRESVWLALLDHGAIYELARAGRLAPAAVKPLPKYPGVERDLAIVLKREVAATQVEEAIRAGSVGGLLRGVRLFDEFQSPEMKSAGERSLAFHLTFRSDERTLEEHEVDNLIILIIKRLEGELHARLRA
jgi:phenylalanyl-tRNA synthetase beta chain